MMILSSIAYFAPSIAFVVVLRPRSKKPARVVRVGGHVGNPVGRSCFTSPHWTLPPTRSAHGGGDDRDGADERSLLLKLSAGRANVKRCYKSARICSSRAKQPLQSLAAWPPERISLFTATAVENKTHV
jgi:hypothetical protein